MTYEEASRDIIHYMANGCCNGENALCRDTLNTGVSALSKQIPKEPRDVTTIDAMGEKYQIGLCSDCGSVVDNTENYCRKCGQATLWGSK